MKDGWAVDSRSAVLIALVLLGLVGSQICVKAGLARSGGVVLSSGEGVASVLRLLRQPLLWLGLGFTGIAAVLWLEVLSRVSLSVAYPFLSLSYVIMLFAAHWFLRDPITWPRVMGALLVCAGMLLIGRRV